MTLSEIPFSSKQKNVGYRLYTYLVYITGYNILSTRSEIQTPRLCFARSFENSKLYVYR